MVRGLGLPARGAGLVWRLVGVLTLLATLLAGMLSSAAPAAAATAITVGGGWSYFSVSSVGVGAAEEPFTFTSAVAVQLDVTDFLCLGDRFQVFDNATLLGSTSAAIPDPDDCDTTAYTPDGAFADARWSSGSFVLAAGSHSITVIMSENDRGGGAGAALRVEVASQTTTTVARGSATYGDTTATLTATVTSGGSPVPAGGTVTFTFDGQTYPATTNAQGVATATVPLPPGTAAGTYPNRVQASYAGAPGYDPSSGSGPLVVGRKVLWLKPVDRNVGLKQPNPPTDPHLDAANCPAPSYCLELARGSTFAPGQSWSALNLSVLRFQYARNPPSTNATEKVGKTYRITAFGVTSSNYDIRYDPGTMTVK